MSKVLRFSRSPFYWQVEPTASNPVASTTTQVFIWNGLLTDIPTAPTYTFVKAPLGSSNLIVLDLAQLVNDYLVVTYDGTYSIDSYYLFASTIFYDAANVQIGDVVELEETYAFSKGFGYFNEGVNPAAKTGTTFFPTLNYRMTGLAMFSREIQVPESEPINIPVLVTKLSQVDTTVEINFYTGERIGTGIPTGLAKTVIVTNTGVNSNEYIQYVDNIESTTQPQTEAQWDSLVQTTWEGQLETVGDNPTRTVFWCPENDHPTTWISSKYNGTLVYIKVNYLVKDKFMPYKVTFVNSFGALEDFWMMGAEKESLTVNGDTFKRNLLNIPTAPATTETDYNVDAHQYVTFGEQGRKSYTLNTGFIPEENNKTLTELMLSQKIWVTKWQSIEDRNSPSKPLDIEPVVLKSKQLSYKTHLQEKVIDYKIEFQSAHDEVNQVR
tara:strand:+ start:2460 stop:3776 length:1317 start_codon:yes stop_codon:yes gene_type:complete